MNAELGNQGSLTKEKIFTERFNQPKGESKKVKNSQQKNELVQRPGGKDRQSVLRNWKTTMWGLEGVER